jgi:hypothetical protein
VTRRLFAVAGLAGATLALPAPARAHGLSTRADLPIPEWLFGWAAAIVLVLSFVALAVLWPEPKLAEPRLRSLPWGLGRALAGRAVDVAGSLAGVFLFAVALWAGLAGTNNTVENLTPTLVYVAFWVGLVPVSALVGDVYRALNPWRALGRACGWTARRLGLASGEPLPYPARLGYWPAVAGLAAFAWLELVYPRGAEPRALAAAALVYTAVTALGMLLFGTEAWIARGEAFSVYFNLFSRLSAFERHGDEIKLRRPLGGIRDLPIGAGTVALVATMIGTVTFDGASEGSFWLRLEPHLGPRELAGTIGIALAVGLVWGFYRLGVFGAERTSGRLDDTAGRFAFTLVPIACAYVLAHYVSLLVFQGQALVRLISDPAGKGWDLFGTAGAGVDLGLLGADAIWYLQVAFVVCGHVTGLVLAHDRALVLYRDHTTATRSQIWMLGVMVGFTSLALWLLSQANA